MVLAEWINRKRLKSVGVLLRMKSFNFSDPFGLPNGFEVRSTGSFLGSVHICYKNRNLFCKFYSIEVISNVDLGFNYNFPGS